MSRFAPISLLNLSSAFIAIPIISFLLVTQMLLWAQPIRKLIRQTILRSVAEYFGPKVQILSSDIAAKPVSTAVAKKKMVS